MKEFVKAMLIRAIRTIAQTAIATIGSSAVLSDVNWLMVLSASALAGVLSVLTSIATGLPEVSETNEASWDEFKDTITAEYEPCEYDDLYVDDSIDEGDDNEVE